MVVEALKDLSGRMVGAHVDRFLLAWRKGAPHDHFELTRPFTASTPSPVLLVRADEGAGSAVAAFAAVEKVGERTLPAGKNAERHVTFYSLSGYKGQ